MAVFFYCFSVGILISVALADAYLFLLRLAMQSG